MYPFDSLTDYFLEIDNIGKEKFDTLILKNIHNIEYTIGIGNNFKPDVRQDFFRIFSNIDYIQNYINILNKYFQNKIILNIGIHTERHNYVFKASIKSIDISHYNTDCNIWFKVEKEITEISDIQLMHLMSREKLMKESGLSKEDTEKILAISDVKNDLDILILISEI